MLSLLLQKQFRLYRVILQFPILLILQQLIYHCGVVILCRFGWIFLRIHIIIMIRQLFQLANSPVITITPSLPYLQNFEANNGSWFGDGKSNSWEYGTPASTKINRAASGSKAPGRPGQPGIIMTWKNLISTRPALIFRG